MSRPEQYGMRTVHTGNAPHAPQCRLSQIYLARRYAKANGYEGASGGWIYARNGQHIAHDYSQFFHSYGFRIRRWACDVLKMGIDTADDVLAEAMRGRRI